VILDRGGTNSNKCHMANEGKEDLAKVKVEVVKKKVNSRPLDC
jgi:hypothetical protein